MAFGATSYPTPPFEPLLAAINTFTAAMKSAGAETLADDLIQFRQVIDLLELGFSELAGRFSTTHQHERWGSNTPIDWIRHECKMAGSAAADRVTVGEQLAALPQSVAAVRNASIGFGHLCVIAQTADAIARSRTGRAFDETGLLRQAKDNSVGKLRHLALHFRHAQDPDGVASDEAYRIERRELSLSSCEDGWVRLSGIFDSAGGAAIRTALEPLARPAGKSDDRWRERRLADALVELATHALDSGVLPTQAGLRPHLHISASLDTLRGELGSRAGELEFSLPISSKTVQRLACDSSVIRVLFGAESAVIDVGRARRVVAAATRRALNARDRTCRWPGCERPAAWSAAHHFVHWVHGGETNLANLILLCHPHHTRVHEGGWRLVLAGDRVITIPPAHALFPVARAPNAAAA